MPEMPGRCKGLGFAFLVGLAAPQHQAQTFVVLGDVGHVQVVKASDGAGAGPSACVWPVAVPSLSGPSTLTGYPAATIRATSAPQRTAGPVSSSGLGGEPLVT